jgi:hypothetical protein
MLYDRHIFCLFTFPSSGILNSTKKNIALWKLDLHPPPGEGVGDIHSVLYVGKT